VYNAGISDYDHTRPSRHDRSSRSRSGDREKSQTPESSGRPRAVLASGRKTPATPAGGSTGKKAGAGSKGKSDQMRQCLSEKIVFSSEVFLENTKFYVGYFLISGNLGAKVKILSARDLWQKFAAVCPKKVFCLTQHF